MIPSNFIISSIPVLLLSIHVCLAGVAEDRAADSTAVWAFKTANPSSLLHWDSTVRYNNWRGVSVDPQTGRVTQLWLSEDSLTTIPKEIATLTGMTNLVLSMNQIKYVPKEIGKLVNLTGLNFNTNKLDSIPSEIGNLDKLKGLDLNNNKIAKLPSSLGKLPNLLSFTASNNLLSQFPVEITNNTEINHLNFDQNRITSLPASIGKLTNLATLRIDNNKLTNIPVEIAQLPKLTLLDLFKNQITHIPPGIDSLKELTHLDLSFNLLSQLPQCFFDSSAFPKLKSLGLHQNYVLGSDTTALKKAYPFAYVSPQNPRIHLTLKNTTALDKNYDASDTTTITAVMSGIFSGHEVGLSCRGTFPSSAPGTNLSVSTDSSLCFLTGDHAGIYDFTLPKGLKASIKSEATPILAAKFNNTTLTWSQALMHGQGRLRIFDIQGHLIGSSSLPMSENRLNQQLKSFPQTIVLQVDNMNWVHSRAK